MYRPRKKKEPSLLDELKELKMIDEGKMVNIPELENDDLIEENLMSVVVRCMNPAAHKVGGLVTALPPIWGLEDKDHGRDVREDKVQFIFQSDGDLHHVLTRGPWFVNGWIVSMDQWTPNPRPDFLCKIPFWIRIRGIPTHLLKKQAIESLVGPLGKIENVELHAKHSISVEYVRAQVWIDADAPLQLTHDQTRCPEQPPEQEPATTRLARGRETSRSDKGFRRETITGGSSRSETVAARTLKSQVVPVTRTSRSSEHRKKDDKKGKNAATPNTQIWKKKESASTPKLRIGETPKAQESPPCCLIKEQALVDTS
ncbi:hypothetical protein F2Q69_00044379 [Brassica cretica]|uniref:DUF4283 domain-containing protein n=1 Tax=Brassica cretica TaxID=69181 RepID=A0A8S9NTM9_BRACR|nr:hypothetical protein F2Q69_00044379 [Brassica cretica]